jgi:hypothetical protein
MIEYFRLNIEYLWNAACREPRGRTIDLKKDRVSRFINLEPNWQLFGKMSIVNEDFGSIMPFCP